MHGSIGNGLSMTSSAGHNLMIFSLYFIWRVDSCVMYSFRSTATIDTSNKLMTFILINKYTSSLLSFFLFFLFFIFFNNFNFR